MIKLAYIQKNKGEFFSETAYSFWSGCEALGIDTKFFEQSSGLDDLDLNEETMVFGGIKRVREAFTKLGVIQPTFGEMPPACLLDMYGRKIWATTMAEVRQGYEDNKFFFIKPLRVHKLFSGHVTSESIGSLARTAPFPDDLEIQASDVMYFSAEYRLFIHEGRIRDCRFYRGDFRKLVDFSVSDRCIEAHVGAPVAYSLDLWVSDHDGKTYVVEMNDAFSLGGYGIPSIPYITMVVDRWEEIIKSRLE